jgi:arginyl-tRNA--protein-N-Asp/Glu arginylyltransferase
MHQAFECSAVPPEFMDRLWAAGWRHFGVSFFRYSFDVVETKAVTIWPLRLDLEKFVPTKSQRRVLRKNQDARCEFVPATLSAEARAMFHEHKTRFADNVPEELDCFLSDDPARVPCPCLECRVWLGDELAAISYLDLGAAATSAVYGIFSPRHSSRSLGLFTMLREIEHSRGRGCRYYYPGYAAQEASHYDYKKQFTGLEYLDWGSGEWLPLPREAGS